MKPRAEVLADLRLGAEAALEELLHELETEEADQPGSANCVIDEVLKALDAVKKIGV